METWELVKIREQAGQKELAEIREPMGRKEPGEIRIRKTAAGIARAGKSPRNLDREKRIPGNPARESRKLRHRRKMSLPKANISND